MRARATSSSARPRASRRALELATIDGINGFRIEGIDAGDDSGRSVAGAGDVNGDGFDDVIIGAHRADPGGADRAGETYVVFGRASGIPASIALSSLDGTNGFRLDGIHAWTIAAGLPPKPATSTATASGT